MAIYKTGDEQPIDKIYKPGGDTVKCSKCGKDIVVIAVKENESKPVCVDCDSD